MVSLKDKLNKIAASLPEVELTFSPSALYLTPEELESWRRMTRITEEIKPVKPPTKEQLEAFADACDKHLKKENKMKNVLFLAPSYPYAKTVVSNQSKELDRKKIPYTASLVPDDVYILTDNVRVEIIYIDPLKYTIDIFNGRDAVFGKKALVEKAMELFYTTTIFKPTMSLSKYIVDANNTHVVIESKPRETYIPEIKNAYFNDPVTVVMWEDGTKTMVRCQNGDAYSPETGLALCIAKKSLGNMPNFNNVFKKWIPEQKPVDISTTESETVNTEVIY